jgi:hypothetical protein
MCTVAERSEFASFFFFFFFFFPFFLSCIFRLYWLIAVQSHLKVLTKVTHIYIDNFMYIVVALNEGEGTFALIHYDKSICIFVPYFVQKY